MRLKPPVHIWNDDRELAAWCRQCVLVDSFTVATLPDATMQTTFIYVTDAAGGAIPAFNDGTNWRRFDTRAIVT